MVIVIAFFFIKHISKKIEPALKRYDFLFILVNTFILIYTYLVAIYRNTLGNGITIVSSVFNFFIFVVIYPYFSTSLFESPEDFSKSMLYASFIQSVIVIISFLVPGARTFIESIQYNPENFSRYYWRIIGLGIAGAGGSVYLFTGLMSAGYLYLKKQLRLKDSLAAMIIIVSIVLVGRTGLYCVIALFVFFAVRNMLFVNKIKIKDLKIVVGIIVVIIILGFIVGQLNIINKALFSYTINRAFELFSSSGMDIVNYLTSIPPLTMETIVGTGITRGTTSSGLYFWNDNGYVQRYGAMGLIACIISYLSYIYLVIMTSKKLPKSEKSYIIFCLLLLYIIEYKEPFIYMLAYPYVLIMIARLCKKNEEEQSESVITDI